MKKTLSIFTITLLCLTLTSCNQNREVKEQKAKYVFYFIGDGMGLAHIALTEAYLSYKETGDIGMKPLSFTQFPVFGLCTNYSASNWITDSSAAGTALSTGEKTTNTMLGMSPDSTNLTSISYKIKENGFGVGISTTVPIDDATPAAFYANNVSRRDFYNIGAQIAESGLDFFAGMRFRYPFGKDYDKESLFTIAQNGGYTIANGENEFYQKCNLAQKMLMLQDTTFHFVTPYIIDHPEDALNGEKIVTAAITFLEKNYPNGFFLMHEGGAIDWASHVNDAKTVIYEVLDFSKSISVAVEFAKKHPKETLIVVTADHETGGLSLGREKGYVYDFDPFEQQTHSKELLSVTPGENRKDINDYITFVDEMNTLAHIGWTSRSHTGIFIPIYAFGINSQLFAGRMDNTDVPKRICQAMGIEFSQKELK